MNFYNKVLDKKSLKRIVSWFIDNYGPTRTTLLLDEFKTVGFHYAGKAGLSLGFDDLRIPLTKKNLLATAQDQVQLCEKTYSMGLITAFERYQKLIDIWTTTSEKLKDEVIQNFESIQGGPLASPLYMMAFSGARGNISQVRQLVGMRGLMSDSGGGIIDFPIRSNFREGLSVTEYVISCYGARKGLIDTALRTADSGYLTRRLVDVAHGIIIREIDCGSYESVFIKVSDTKNLIGRALAETLSPGGNDQRTTGPSTERRSSKPSFWRNQEISPRVAVELKTLKGSKASIAVRSPLTCLSQSVCQLCYGWNLAQGRLVSLGDAVGILAAQSIGEPGTQLTMRTFHTGGIFSSEVEDKVYSPQEGIVFIQSPERGSGPSASGRINPPQTFGRGTELLQLRPSAAAAADQRSGLELRGTPAAGFGSRDLGSFGPSVDNSVLLRGCKIRSVHGQTAFFVFDSIQLKIQNQIVKDQRTQSSGTSFCRESIVQLPPQSIIFVSPGNTLKKNTLFAEISRIQQPPTLLDDQPEALEALNRTFGQLRTSGSQPSVEHAGPLVSRSPPKTFGPSVVATEGRALRGTKFTAFGSRDLWSKGASPDQRPLVLQSSSPPSEQGSPRPGAGPLVNGLRHERRFKLTSSPSRLSEAEPSAESRGQKNIKQNFHRDIDLNSLREAAAAEGRSRGRPKKQKSIQLKDNLQLASRKVFSEIQGEVMEIFENPKKHPANVLPSSPLERSSKLPRPAGGSHRTEAHLQGRPDLQGRSPGPTKLRVVLSGEAFVFRPHKRKTNPSGFRQGDIVFWKGQRKELVSTGLQHQTTPGFRNQNWETKFLHPEQIGPLAATFVGRLPAAIPPFEIRRVQGPDDGAGETRPTALKGKQSKLDNQLQYSGLIVHFEHQKEKQTKVDTSSRPSVEEQSSCQRPPEAPFGPKKNQKEKIGKLCQPYRNYKAFLGSQTPSLNLPTQILRRRKNKLILRHVQVSLGMDQRSLVENSVPQPKTFGGLRLGTLPPADFGRHPESSGKNASSQVSRGLTSFSHYVKERDLLFQLILPISQSSSSSDIVQGLPKIEQLFEARARFNDNRSKQSAPTIGPEATRRPKSAGPSVEERSSCGLRQPPEAPFGPSVSPERTSFVPRGPTGASGRDELRWAGAPPPPEGSSLRSAEENENTNQNLEERAEGRSTLELRNLQKRLIQEIQLVYNSQGVDIADKHLEIIVRQMTSQIRVLEKGETPYFPEDIVNGVLFHSSKESIETDNLSPLLQNLRWAEPHEVPAEGRRRLPLVLPAETKGSKPLVSVFKQQPASDWVLMGITKVALLATTESYISAASFQETKRVLMNSALQTRVDFFEGLKENVIVGRMIPAGTGAKG